VINLRIHPVILLDTLALSGVIILLAIFALINLSRSDPEFVLVLISLTLASMLFVVSLILLLKRRA